MKKLIPKYLMVSCKDATFLMSKKEEGKLSFIEMIKLPFHTSMCKFCRKFKKQTSRINEECKLIHSQNNLSALAKEKIERMLREYST